MAGAGAETMMAGPDVWWIRHGESVRNAGHRTVDTYSAPLTEIGWKQARAAAAVLPGRPDLIVHSSFLRASQTAGPAMERFPGGRAEVWPVHEYHYLCDQRTRDTTRMDREPMVREYWERCDPHWVSGVGAESFAGFIGRVDSALERLRQRPERWIVIYSHQQFMQGVMFRMGEGRGAPDAALMRRFARWVETEDVPNTSMVRTVIGASNGADVLGPVRPLEVGWV